MTKIYVIRHAEAEGNIFRRIHGQYNSRITANGYRQIEALKKRFLDVPLDGVYASDLFRTCETAKALYGPKGLPLQKDPRFREVNLGRWEDIPFGYLDVFEAEQLHNFNLDPENWIIDGAESYREYTDRFLDGLREIGENHPGKTVAVFTHGAVSSGAFRRLFGTGPLDGLRCDNTGISLLSYHHGEFSRELMYDNSHLTDDISTLSRQNWWRGKRDFNIWFRAAKPEDSAIYHPDFLPGAAQNILIAMLGWQPVGYLSYRADAQVPTLSSIFLLPEFRHRRMGDQLFGEAVCRLRADGKQLLQIGVPTACTEAISFFTRMNCRLEQMDDVYTVFSYRLSLPEY